MNEIYQSNKKVIKQYLNAVDDSFIISHTDTKGIITYANKAFCKISKYSHEELIGQPHSIVRHPDVAKHVFSEMWKKIKSGRIWTGSIKNIDKDGEEYFVKTMIFPIYEDGKIVEYIALREDITDLVEAKKKIKTEKKLLKTILKHSGNTVLVFKNSISIKKIKNNFGINSLYKCENQEDYFSFLLKDEHELFYIVDSNWYDEIIDKSPKKIEKDNKIFSAKYQKITIDNSKVIIATFTDITDIEKARIEADEAQKLKSLFLANMSHEIRTPLNAIMGFSNMLSKKDLNELGQKYVKNILHSSEFLLKIINDILDFSKIESNKLTLEYINSDIKEEIIQTFEMLKSFAKDKQIEYSLSIDENLYQYLRIDVVRTEQILTNLINNAIKFTPEKGSVDIKVEVIENHKTYQKVKFCVEDTGIGIPKNKLDTIFKAFLQADNSTTRKFGGTGLGLSISSNLVKLMGGELKVESTPYTKTKFFFELNLRKCDGNDLNKKQDDFSQNVSYQNLKILVAEDYKMNRILMAELFKQYKINYNFAVNGREAFLKAKTDDYDAIFMDVNMPEMNGIEATKKIREAGIKTKIVALTAHALKGDKEKFLEAGMDDYLIKPLDIAKLNNILMTINSKTNIVSIKKYLTNKFAFSEETTQNLIDYFIQSSLETLNNITKALKDEDYEQMEFFFHQLRGSSVNIGFNEIYEIASKLEESAKNREEIDYISKINKIKELLSN